MTLRPIFFALPLALVACGSAPTEIEQPDVDPEAARQAPEDPTPVTPREVPEGADAAGVTNPPGEGEDATPVLDDSRDVDSVGPTPDVEE